LDVHKIRVTPKTEEHKLSYSRVVSTSSIYIYTTIYEFLSFKWKIFVDVVD
jgi:hypothetical protein